MKPGICKRGHDLTVEGSRYGRACRICVLERNKLPENREKALKHQKAYLARRKSGKSAGRRGPPRKISDEQLTELFSLYDTGEWTKRALAERYGLSAGYVGHLLNGNVEVYRTGYEPVARPVRYIGGAHETWYLQTRPRPHPAKRPSQRAACLSLVPQRTQRHARS